MHYLVKLLVEAETAEEALEQAREDADNMVERGEFDYYDFYGRWGESQAYAADSEEGKQHIKEAMEAARREFDEGLAVIRYMLENYSDDDIYEENFGSYEELKDKLPENVYRLSKWQFMRAAGDSHGPTLYSEGSKVDGAKSLEYQFKFAKNPLWVVPVDFHY